MEKSDKEFLWEYPGKYPIESLEEFFKKSVEDFQ